MGDVINLRKARKQAERELDQLRAAENRLSFGRSKAERKLTSARDAKVRRDLDQHRVEAGDER
jgi:Domain of unknown function (DUF4169)